MPGLRPTLGYLDAKTFTPGAIVDILIAELAEFLAEMERFTRRPDRWWFDR